MKRFTQTLTLVLTAVLLWSGMAVPVLASPSKTYALTNPEQNNQEVEELARELEEKFGITLLYPTMTAEDSRQLATIFPETLRTMDEALSTVTPGLVRKVSAYYYEQNGRRLTFEYVSADMRGPYGDKRQEEVQVGGFHRLTSRVRLYIPDPHDQGVATGDNPLTIVHEFAHAFHYMLTDRYGYGSMEKRWLGLMDGYSFMPKDMDPEVFVTEYASTEYDEDFAETFAHAFICNRPGLGISQRLFRKEGGGTFSTPLGKKVAHVEWMLRLTMSDNLEMLDNFRMVYSAPASSNAAGLRLAGLHLLFINMPEPRLVPLTLINSLAVQEKNTVWFPSLGGWYCQDDAGDHLVLFPEGTYGYSGRDMTEYKAELDAKLADDLAYARWIREERSREREQRQAQSQASQSQPSSQPDEASQATKDEGTPLPGTSILAA